MGEQEFNQLSHQELMELARRLCLQVHERLGFEQLRRLVRQSEVK
jgi:hypothetical protein